MVKNLLREYGEDAPVADAGKTFFTFDCNAPANTIPYANNQQICRDFAGGRNIRVFDVDQGIGSHLLIEQGLCRPGFTAVGTDSHMNILGAVGAFGQGMGDADIAYGFRWGRTWFEVPPTMKVQLNGRPGPNARPKDITLAVLRVLGSRGGLGRAIEFEGELLDSLGLSGRITLASMATEMGAIIGLLSPDEEVLRFLRERSGGAAMERLEADRDAAYVEEVAVDLEGLGSLVARPGSPRFPCPSRCLSAGCSSKSTRRAPYSRWRPGGSFSTPCNEAPAWSWPGPGYRGSEEGKSWRHSLDSLPGNGYKMRLE